MSKTLTVPTIAAFAAIALAPAQASQAPNFAGTYRCEVDSKRCDVAGETYTVTQNGNTLDVKNDKGTAGQGTVISPISISMGPWNMMGVVQEDSRTIQWSNGTEWRKQ
jgi:hypothetical protein